MKTRDVGTSYSLIDGTNGQKIKESRLGNSIDQLYLTDICRQFHPTGAEHIYVSGTESWKNQNKLSLKLIEGKSQ